MKKKLYAIILPLMILTGCSVTPKERVVTKVEYQYKSIPSALLKACQITPPPKKEEYVNASDSKKLDLLSELSIKLYGDLKACNDQVSSIREYDMKQKTIIQENTHGK